MIYDTFLEFRFYLMYLYYNFNVINQGKLWIVKK